MRTLTASPRPSPRAFAALLLLFGCNLAPKQSDPDDDDTGASSSDATAFAINDGTIADGETVTLEGLVVTSPFTRDGEGFFVADPAGGAGSGLYVWSQGGVSGFPVAEGDEVRISGTVSDFYGWIELVVGGSDDVEVTGEATPPAAADLGTGDGVDWNAYESVLVTVSSQEIVSVNEYNTGTLSCGVSLDDGFLYLDFECGGAYESVTGIVFYSYEEHSLNPRTEADLGAYSASGSVVDATVAEVQAGGICGRAHVTGVVATTEDFGEDESMFFVQDPAGGENSGVAVFINDTTMDVSIGDVFDITGAVQEAYGLTEIYVTDTADVVLSSSGATPVATTLTEAAADWEVWEGALLTLTDVEVQSSESYGQVETNYGIYLHDELGDFDYTEGDLYASVTGVLYYSYSEWKLEPRSADDLVR